MRLHLSAFAITILITGACTPPSREPVCPDPSQEPNWGTRSPISSPLDGGTLIAVTDDGYALSSSGTTLRSVSLSDGATQTWTVAASGPINWAYAARGGTVLILEQPRGLWSWTAADGPRLLTNYLWNPPAGWSTAISPDEHYVAYVRSVNGNDAIETVIVDTATGTQQVVQHNGAYWTYLFSRGPWFVSIGADTLFVRPDGAAPAVVTSWWATMFTGATGARGLAAANDPVSGNIKAFIFDGATGIQETALASAISGNGGPQIEVSDDESAGLVLDPYRILWRIDLPSGQADQVAYGVGLFAGMNSNADRLWYTTEDVVHVLTGDVDATFAAARFLSGPFVGTNAATASWMETLGPLAIGAPIVGSVVTAALCGGKRTLTTSGSLVLTPSWRRKAGHGSWVVYYDGSINPDAPRLMAGNALTGETVLIHEYADAKLSPSGGWVAYVAGDTLYGLPLP